MVTMDELLYDLFVEKFANSWVGVELITLDSNDLFE
jgi:hypothetical protein